MSEAEIDALVVVAILTASNPMLCAIVANGLRRIDFQGEGHRLDASRITPQSFTAPECPEFKFQQPTKFGVIFVHKTE